MRFPKAAPSSPPKRDSPPPSACLEMRVVSGIAPAALTDAGWLAGISPGAHFRSELVAQGLLQPITHY